VFAAHRIALNCDPRRPATVNSIPEQYTADILSSPPALDGGLAQGEITRLQRLVTALQKEIGAAHFDQDELRKEKEAAVRRCVQLEKDTSQATEASRVVEQRAAYAERCRNDNEVEVEVLMAKLRKALFTPTP